MKVRIIYSIILIIGFQFLSCKDTRKISGEVKIDFEAKLPNLEGISSESEGTIVLRASLIGSDQDFIKYKAENTDDEKRRLAYYTLNFKQDVFLISNSDTIPCIDSHMEQLYMNIPYRTFLLYFGDRRITDKDEILIQDRIFSNKIIVAKINFNS